VNINVPRTGVQICLTAVGNAGPVTARSSESDGSMIKGRLFHESPAEHPPEKVIFTDSSYIEDPAENLRRGCRKDREGGDASLAVGPLRAAGPQYVI
jgi:hypothetical protein